MTRKTFKMAFYFSACCLVVILLGSRAVIHGAAKGKTYADVIQIPHRPAGLVPGCAEIMPNGRKNMFFAHRIAAAAKLYQHQKLDFIIVSGDNHKAGYDEPTAMKNALMRQGVPEDKIYCDYAGFRTLDSVVRAREIFGQTNITVVSQEFHNQRAIYIAQHKGIDAIGFNAEGVGRRYSFRTLAREQFARVKTVLDIMVKTRPKFYGEPIIIPSNDEKKIFF